MTVARCEARGRRDGQSLRARELFPAKWAAVRRSERVKCEEGRTVLIPTMKSLERENASTSHRLYEPLPAEFK